MKTFKILISMLLIFSLIPMAVTFAQEDTESTEIILNETNQYKKLAAFGVFDENAQSIESQEEISRGIFMKYAMSCYFGNGVYPLVDELEMMFADVDSSTDGAREIAVANKMGIVNGNGSSSFRPDDSIKSSEAAKILVTVLGYGEIAENSGGYPTGYLSLANKLDLFDGCTFTENDALTPVDFANILVNTLEADVMEISAIHMYNPGISKTYSTEDKMLLEYVFDIHKIEGIIESNEYTSIYGKSDVDNGEVKIKRTKYIANNSGATELIGYNTQCYYKLNETGTKRVIVYAEPFDNNEIVVDGDYVDKENVTTTSFSYYKDASATKASNAKISQSATLIYNGGQKKLTADALCPANGTVTLIDNNSDNVYDVISVINYRTILVSSVSARTYTVADALGGKSIVLDPTDDKYDVKITVDGKDAQINDILEKSVISYTESEGCVKNIKYVRVSTKSVEGTPESIGDDTITIDGKEYLITKDLIQSVSLRDTGTFYLDFSGKIVARTVERDVVYGYLNEVYKESGINPRVHAQIFTENDRWVELELCDRILYNDKPADATLFYNDCNAISNKGYRELITYTVDEIGRINMIRKAKSFTPYSAAEKNAIEQDIFRVYDEVESAVYRNTAKTFDGKLLINESTRIFAVPDQTSGIDAPLDQFYIMPISTLKADEKYPNITPYDLNEVRLAPVIVMRGLPRVIDAKSSFMVVDSVVNVLNNEGIAVKGIKGYYKGTLFTFVTKSSSVLQDIELGRGDVIQYVMDEEDNITMVELKYDYSDADNQPYSSTLEYKSNSFVVGNIYCVDPKVSKFVIDSAEKGIISMDGNTVINIYDSKTKTVTVGTPADLEKGDKFFVRVQYFSAKDMVVYR